MFGKAHSFKSKFKKFKTMGSLLTLLIAFFTFSTTVVADDYSAQNEQNTEIQAIITDDIHP